MKRRLYVFIGIFCIAILTVSSQSTQGKPDKPPGKDKPHPEWIQFLGPDLVTPEGGEVVEGCCPNAGPNPPYSLFVNFPVYDVPAGLRHGNVFMNVFGHGQNREYLVKFGFTYEETYYCLKILGGVMDYDKQSRVLTVTFTDAPCTDNNTGAPIAEVNFTLIRYPLY